MLSRDDFLATLTADNITADDSFLTTLVDNVNELYDAHDAIVVEKEGLTATVDELTESNTGLTTELEILKKTFGELVTASEFKGRGETEVKDEVKGLSEVIG